MPDLFSGDPAPESILTNGMGNFDIMAWAGKHGPDATDPIIEAVLKEMRGSMGCKKIGAVGYCFGGCVVLKKRARAREQADRVNSHPLSKFVVRFLRAGEAKVDVGYIAHPSFLMADEVKEMKGPLAVAAAETDHVSISPSPPPVFPRFETPTTTRP